MQYTNYVNEDGLILNGTETGIYGPSQLSVTYLADIDVTDATGANRGSLDANAVVHPVAHPIGDGLHHARPSTVIRKPSRIRRR